MKMFEFSEVELHDELDILFAQYAQDITTSIESLRQTIQMFTTTVSTLKASVEQIAAFANKMIEPPT